CRLNLCCRHWPLISLTALLLCTNPTTHVFSTTRRNRRNRHDCASRLRWLRRPLPSRHGIKVLPRRHVFRYSRLLTRRVPLLSSVKGDCPATAAQVAITTCPCGAVGRWLVVSIVVTTDFWGRRGAVGRDDQAVSLPATTANEWHVRI